MKARLPEAGGAEAFRRFLEDELRPFIEQRYRTAPRWILAGHSLAGLFTLYDFASPATRFTGFAALSPVLGWQDGAVLRLAQARAASPGHEATLYLSTADEGSRYPPTATRALDSTLSAIHPAGVRWRYQHFSGEDHATTLMPALTSGLRWLLNGD